MSEAGPGRGPRDRPPFLGLRRLRLRELRWLDALVFSLPLWLVLVFLVGAPVVRYLDARVFDDWWTRSEKLERLADAQLRTLQHLPEALSVSLRLDAEHRDPRWIRLHVDRDLWNEWQSAPLALDRVWIDATLFDGRRMTDVKLRKRGDTSVHWLTPKKSFTLKTGRSELFRGHRRLVFSVKTPLEQFVVGKLAQDFGLLAPETFLAPVFLNDRFYGVFRGTELIDESLLRRLERMPGDVFRGDTAERGENFRGLDRNLFHSPALWERVAFNDRPTRPVTSGLERLLSHLLRADAEAVLEREQLFEPGELARLLAFLLVAGDPYHMTNLHNQFWYEDPSSGRLHPVVWDIRLLPLEADPPHPLNSGFVALLRDPRLVDAVMSELAARREEGTLLGRSLERLEEVGAALADPLRYEALRRGVVPDLRDPQEVRDRLESNVAILSGWIDDARVGYVVGAPDPKGWRTLDVLVSGRAPVEWVGFAPGAEPRDLVADADRSGRRDARDLPIVPKALAAGQGLRLLPATSTDSWGIEPAPQLYRFFVRGEARPRFRNGLTGEPVAAETLAAGTALSAGPGHHPWSLGGYGLPVGGDGPDVVRLAGRVELTETLRIAPHQRLEIAPGAVLRLAPDVSIFSRGQVLAEGTAERPIRVEALDPKLPWGSVALLGEGASGSRFSYATFEKGGGAELDAVEFKGMVAVHWATDVVFESCRFRENLRSDDALNAVHAEVDVLDSDFARTNADSLDFDYSEGEIRGNRFADSGNDAIDLMTSNPRIVGNRIERSGDKGVSIGEASDPWIEGNAIRACVTGLEVKDRSAPWIVANRLEDNGVDLIQRMKNWRYGGGGRAKWIGAPLAEVPENVDGASRLTREEGPTPPGWIVRSILAEERFERGFERLPEGRRWEVRGARTQLERRDGELILRARRAPGAARRAFEAPAAGLGQLEYALGPGQQAELLWEQDGLEQVVALAASEPGGSYAFATWPLASAGAGRLTLRAEPSPTTGQAELRVQAIRFLGGAR